MIRNKPKTHLNEIECEMTQYMGKRQKVRARELAELVGISIPSVRVHLLKLMAMGFVEQEKTRNHQVWFFLKDGEE